MFQEEDGANPHGGGDEQSWEADIEEIDVLPHALERFIARWEALHGRALDPSKVLDQLHTLIINAHPEQERKATQKRRASHDGCERYLVNPPWRFVFSGNRLMTCEIALECIGKIRNPHIDKIRSRFFLRIAERPDRGCTQIRKAFDAREVWTNRRELNLVGKPEINAIIRSLRAVGISVDYARAGTAIHREAEAEIALPQALSGFGVYQIPDTKQIVLVFGESELFPLGLRRVPCAGITELDFRQIIEFLLDEDWLKEMQEYRDAQRLRDTNPVLAGRSIKGIKFGDSGVPINTIAERIRGKSKAIRWRVSGVAVIGDKVFQSTVERHGLRNAEKVVREEILRQIRCSPRGSVHPAN